MSQINDICIRFRSIDPLSREQERLIFSQYRYLRDRLALIDRNDPEYDLLEEKIKKIQDTIVRANIRFVCVVARPFAIRSKVDIEDMVAEGIIGLMRAMDKFEVVANTKFISYAVYWIRNHMERSLETAYTVRLNYGVIRNIEGFKKDRGRIEQMLQRSVSLRDAVDRNEECTTKPTWDSDTWDLIEGGHIVSLDKSYHEDGEDPSNLPIAQRIADPNEVDPLSSRRTEERKAYINDMLTKALDYRERKAVEWFYGLNGNTKRTCEVIARDLNFSRQRVSQILEGAERKLLRYASTYGRFSDLIGVN
tara:strand:+ start:165 stop:1085 length:921 start_codon:yes stop_codon:yes gene_type:complete